MATPLNAPATADIIARATALFEDLSFTSAREWKAAKPGRKVIGYMPIYVPRELIHAADMLPLGIVGGGDQLEVLCHRATLARLRWLEMSMPISFIACTEYGDGG